jgi:teichuronic acid biosynthesis glycosyltransferase TuaC
MTRRLVLCSLSIPWPEAVATGQYNVLQAKALRQAGWHVSLFKPVPWIPSVVSKISARGARWRRHPERYELDGIPVHAPRVPFLYASTIRFRLARVSPGLVASWFRIAVRPAFERHVRSEGVDAAVFHSTLPWGAVATELPHVFIDRSWRDVERWCQQSRARRLVEAYVGRARGHFTSGRTLQDMYQNSLPACGTEYLPNGVVRPTAEQQKAPPPPGWRDRTMLLCVGSYLPRKGHRVLFDAIAELADPERLRLVLVGPPPPHLREHIERLEIGGLVEVLPRMPQEELLQYMVWADLFVLPSWAEAFGNVYAEAMASGTPVVLTSDSGMAREIVHREHGWIVEPRSAGSLATALEEALGADLKAVGSAGQKLVRERFSWEHNAARLTSALTGEAP